MQMATNASHGVEDPFDLTAELRKARMAADRWPGYVPGGLPMLLTLRALWRVWGMSAADASAAERWRRAIRQAVGWSEASGEWCGFTVGLCAKVAGFKKNLSNFYHVGNIECLLSNGTAGLMNGRRYDGKCEGRVWKWGAPDAATPAGAIVTFDWSARTSAASRKLGFNGGDHVELLLGVDGSTLWTIGGNTTGLVYGGATQGNAIAIRQTPIGPQDPKVVRGHGWLSLADMG